MGRFPREVEGQLTRRAMMRFAAHWKLSAEEEKKALEDAKRRGGG